MVAYHLRSNVRVALKVLHAVTCALHTSCTQLEKFLDVIEAKTNQKTNNKLLNSVSYYFWILLFDIYA